MQAKMHVLQTKNPLREIIFYQSLTSYRNFDSAADVKDPMEYHNGRTFYTYDQGIDVSGRNCASKYNSGLYCITHIGLVTHMK